MKYIYPPSSATNYWRTSVDVTNGQTLSKSADNPPKPKAKALWRRRVHTGTTPACRNAALRRAGTGLPVGLHILLILSLLFSGCATYKFHLGKKPFDTGYVVSRDNRTILEYTIGKDNTVPDLKLAKERFNRRRRMVEHYYKKMGYIENNFKKNFWMPVEMFLNLLAGVLRLPFMAVSDYRYEHNPTYREKIDKVEQQRDAREKARIDKLKDRLNIYIQHNLAKETP